MGCLGTLGGRKVGVSRAHREAIGLAYGFAGRDLEREIELAHERAHHEELLIVLFPEHRDAGAHAVEELEHYGGHAVEEAGPELAFELLAERSGAHADGLRLGI